MAGQANQTQEEGLEVIPMHTLDEKNEFLRKDLHDALMWLFVGAVVWQAADPLKKNPKRCPHQRALGLYMNIVQARALYEFYCQKKRDKEDDARARDFAPSWKRPENKPYYSKYMDGDGKAPASKRVFHLVYGRSKHSGRARRCRRLRRP